MWTWRAVAVACALMLGCGEPIAQQELPAGEEGTGETSQKETGEGKVSAPWKNEPSPFGPVRLVKDVFPETGRSGEPPSNLVSFRGELSCSALQEDGRMQLWRSNGTEAGTVLVMEFPPVRNSRGFFESLSRLNPVGSFLFFTVADKVHGRELWVTDGTHGGTRRVKELTPGPEDSTLGNLVTVGSRLFFFRTVGAAPELWVTDGTREGTRRVKELTPGPDNPVVKAFMAAGKHLFFFRTGGAAPSPLELWTSDGTAAGTVRVRNFGPRTVDWPIARGDTLFVFLSAPDGTSELWRTDGSSASTLRLRTFDPGPEGHVLEALKVVGRLVYFIVDTSSHGDELWKTDGSVAGTQLVMTGPANTFLQLLDVARESLFFTIRSPDATEMRLYKLNVSGSPPGEPKLVMLLPHPVGTPDFGSEISAFATTGEKLFFSWFFFGPGAGPSAHQLWVTDGTRSGTQLLHEPLNLSDEYVTELFAVDALLLFPGVDEGKEAGGELWWSDGTVKGTRPLKDIKPGFSSSYPNGFTRVGDDVFFSAFREGVGQALWAVSLRHSRHAAPDSSPLE